MTALDPRDGDRVFFSLPNTWRGVAGVGPFTETGGWAFVLVWQKEAWRVRGYGWAVTHLAVGSVRATVA
jgi:hypothetical protein